MTNENLEKIKKHFCFDCNEAKSNLIYAMVPEDAKAMIIAIDNHFIIHSELKVYKDLVKKKFKTLNEIIEYLKTKFKSNNTSIDNYYFADSSTQLRRRKSRKVDINPLDRTKAKDFEDFESRCSSEDLDAGQVTLYDILVTGAYIDNTIVGVSSILDINGIYDIGVLVEKDYRRKGIGRSLVYYLSAKTVSENKIVRYTAPFTNKESNALARSINLEHLATLVKIF